MMEMVFHRERLCSLLGAGSVISPGSEIKLASITSRIELALAFCAHEDPIS